MKQQLNFRYISKNKASRFFSKNNEEDYSGSCEETKKSEEAISLQGVVGQATWICMCLALFEAELAEST